MNLSRRGALKMTFEILALGALLIGLSYSGVRAQDDTELAKKTQNPVADLISVPLQNNWNFGAGMRDKTLYVLNVQPVIPINLNADWNLITRVIMPIINQPSLFPGVNGATGLGDINPSFFFSPAKPAEIIWGLGPTMTLPTASDRQLGSGKWSLGPAAVALTIQGPWVFGALINNQWSLGGWGEQHVNQMLLQPFVNYNLPDGWYLSSVPVLTANWAAEKAGDCLDRPARWRRRQIIQAWKTSDQHTAPGVRQRGETGVWSGLAIAFPDSVSVSEMRGVMAQV